MNRQFVRLAVSFPVLLAACSASSISGGDGTNNSDNSGNSGIIGPDGSLTPGAGAGEGSGIIVDMDSSSGPNSLGDPSTCADAVNSQSYIGCDFWPTITANPVWEEFKFAVVVANGQDVAADVLVEGPGSTSISQTIEPGGLATIELPWLAALKGPEFDPPSSASPSAFGRLDTSLNMVGGAYHLTASVPVTAWQFNPLQYQYTNGECEPRREASVEKPCRAASNDASLLLPTSAMTGNYRVAAYSGARGSDAWGSAPSGFAITATANGTQVQVQLPPDCDADYLDRSNGCLLASPDGVVPAAIKNEVLNFTMDAGDVIQLLAAYGPDPQTGHADLSGAIINASANVQVIAFNPIANIPDEVGNADHLDETILPAEVIGKKYIVTPPTAYGGQAIGHIVRIYGNVDGTQLTYPEGKPAGAPDTINAGEVVEVPNRSGANNQCMALNATCTLTESFVVEGTEPFTVGSFQVGGYIQVPNWAEAYTQPGDPSFSVMVTPEQFRKNYTFLAPTSFLQNWADILVPTGASVIFDGSPVTQTPAPIGESGWGILRLA
ncbi:MAG: IgGFc-binding protein, partial [Polyangiaceae bacterium]|nr:IgGFc-binding protein [Polyangiaceae bacterium]